MTLSVRDFAGEVLGRSRRTLLHGGERLNVPLDLGNFGWTERRHVREFLLISSVSLSRLSPVRGDTNFTWFGAKFADLEIRRTLRYVQAARRS